MVCARSQTPTHVARPDEANHLPYARCWRESILRGHRQFPLRPMEDHPTPSLGVVYHQRGTDVHLHPTYCHTVCPQCHFRGTDAAANSRDVPQPVDRRRRRREQKQQRGKPYPNSTRPFPQTLWLHLLQGQ